MRFSRLLSPFIAAVALTLPAMGSRPADPPSDEAVRALADDFRERRNALYAEGHAKLDDIKALHAAPLGDLSLSEMTPSQIAMLNAAGMLQDIPTMETNEPKAGAVKRLRSFESDPGVEGAVARVLLLELAGGATPSGHPEYERQTELLRSALAHPRLDAAVREHPIALLSAVASLGRVRAWKDSREEIIALRRFLDDRMPPSMALELGDYWRVLGYLLDEENEQERVMRQEIRKALVERGRDVLRDGREDLSEKEFELVQMTVDRLDGAAARGELIGHPAPTLDIVWSSDESVESLAGLKGNVIVLDFWATWCGPCIASIPNVRELRARYDGYAVKILGVTSVQGTHYPKDGDPIDTEGDREKEFSLMREYIGQQEITWPIVFSEQPVFNPDYGVRGIPHVAIIDTKGVMRFDGLHPADPLAEKAAKIDALLEEAGLPAPAPLPVEAESDGG